MRHIILSFLISLPFLNCVPIVHLITGIKEPVIYEKIELSNELIVRQPRKMGIKYIVLNKGVESAEKEAQQFKLELKVFDRNGSYRPLDETDEYNLCPNYHYWVLTKHKVPLDSLPIDTTKHLEKIFEGWVDKNKNTLRFEDIKGYDYYIAINRSTVNVGPEKRQLKKVVRSVNEQHQKVMYLMLNQDEEVK
jgi:hypothetical protein